MGQAPLFLNVFVSHAWQEGFDEFVQYVVARLGPLGFGFPEIFYGKVTGKEMGSNFWENFQWGLWVFFGP